MSLTLKLTSLFIRTAAKPIGNWIKSQAREHERFRKTCISFAQGLHRIDMRMRLGLLQDPAAIDRQIAREAAEAEAKRLKAHSDAQVPTVKTEAEAKAADAEKEKTKHDVESKVKGEEKKKIERKIRPLSEAKAIDSGANFISETFLFLVAGGLIVFETLRSRRNESKRREDVAERLGKLEEVIRAAKEAEEVSERELVVLKREVERFQEAMGQSTPVKDEKTTGRDRNDEEEKKQENVVASVRGARARKASHRSVRQHPG